MTLRVNVDLGPLGETSKRTTDAAHIGLVRASLFIRDESVQRTPVESGHLRGSEDVLADGADGYDVYVPGPYARFQEFGPHFNPETLHHEEGMSPYLSTAMTEGAERAIEIIAQAIREEGSFE